MAQETKVHRRLRIAGILIIGGLGFEAVSLFWNSPMSFFLFIAGSGLLILMGILIFLYSLVSGGQSAAGDAGSD